MEQELQGRLASTWSRATMAIWPPSRPVLSADRWSKRWSIATRSPC